MFQKIEFCLHLSYHWIWYYKFLYLACRGTRSLDCTRVHISVQLVVFSSSPLFSKANIHLGVYSPTTNLSFFPVFSEDNNILHYTCVYPLAQLLPAPPPCFERQTFSGLYKLAYGEFIIELITLGSKSNKTALGI